MANWIEHRFDRVVLPALPGACQVVRYTYVARLRRRTWRSLILAVGAATAIAVLTAVNFSLLR